jgi:glycerophosphoryl diester phosphodiesterase
MAPENTMPAFGSAVAMGAQEIEFDLWSTTDGVLVTAHDKKLERVSNGEGLVGEHSLAELKALDFGVKFGEVYKELRIPTFEEILQKLASRVVMNIHVKIWDVDSNDRMIEQIASLIEKYDCVRHVYFMSSHTDALLEMRERLPHAGYCQGSGLGHEHMVEMAIKHRFEKVQFVSWKPMDQSMIDRCHEHGIICNYCQANDSESAKKVLDMGIDCVLTDEFHRVKTGLEKLCNTEKE